MPGDIGSPMTEDLTLDEIIPLPSVLDDTLDWEIERHHVDAGSSGVVFLTIGWDDRFQLITELVR